MKFETTCNALQDLLTRAEDATDGFKLAAEAVDTGDLANLLNEYSKQREQFSKELQKLMVTLGGTPEMGKSLLGKAHQVWMDLRAKLADGNAEDVLDECLRGESKTMDDYRSYLENPNLHMEARDLLALQLHEIETIFRRLTRLENLAAQMSS